MKAKELIAILSRVNPEAEVTVAFWSYDTMMRGDIESESVRQVEYFQSHSGDMDEIVISSTTMGVFDPKCVVWTTKTKEKQSE